MRVGESGPEVASVASVDVAIPNYQQGRYLADAVRSVLTQRGVDRLRVLVIDNASTDGSLAVAGALAAGDDRVRVLPREKNLGHHASFNAAIEWAAADYFLILCADDALAPGALARACGLMDRHPDVALTFGRALPLAGDRGVPGLAGIPGVPAERDPPWRLLSGRALLERFCATGRNVVPGPTCIVRTRVQKAVGPYRTTLPYTDDLEMWLRFTLKGDAAETDALQGFQRIHDDRQSSRMPTMHEWDLACEAAFESFFANEGASLPPRDRARLRARARRSLAERSYWSALTYLGRGDLAAAGRFARFALSRAPSTALLPPIGYALRRLGASRRSHPMARAVRHGAGDR